MNAWCDEQLVVTVEGPPGTREIHVPKPYARIGWHPDSEIVLQGAHVAKRALYLHATPEGVFALNLDREEAPLDHHGRWVGSQEVLALGDFRLRVRLASGDRETVPDSDPVRWGSASPPLPVVRIFCGPLLKDKRRFRARLNVLGRRPQCALQLRGQRVSSFHAALFWDQRRLWCIDLLSGNGTFLNGNSIECAEVALGDRLEIGEFSLVYYRWSPRRSMVPGWQPPPAEPSAHDSDAEAQEVVTCGAEAIPDVPPFPPTAPPLYAELAAEIQRLSQERHDLQQHWQQVVEQLGHQLEELRAETVRLRQEREALQAQQIAWQKQRDELARQLALKTAELSRLQTQRASHAISDSPRSQAAPLADHPPAPEADDAPEHGPFASPAAASCELPAGELDLPVPLSSDGASAALGLATVLETSAATLTAPASGSPSWGRPEAVVRRRTGPHELAGWISDRLIELESARRRKLALLWAAAGLVALAVGTVAFSWWQWRG
jgi:hypothetical protein